DAVYDAALRQLGVERAKTPADLVEIAYACTRGRLPRSRRLAVVTMSGGAGVLMADAAEEERLELTPLADESQKEVVSWVPFAAPRNPVDVTAQALNDPTILDKSFELLLGKENFPAMIGFFTTWASSPQMAEPLFKSVSAAAARYPDRYFALSAIASPEMQRRYEAAGVGLFEDPWAAVAAVAGAMRCAERIATPPLPMPPVPKNLPPLPQGRIAEHEAKRILAEAGVPILDERLVTNAGQAAAAAVEIGERPARRRAPRRGPGPAAPRHRRHRRRFVEALGDCRGAEGAIHEHRRHSPLAPAERPGRGGDRRPDFDPIRRRER